ncbi:MAG: hypothetical protein FWB98_08370, partial [Defluviitaleaceae bacterium]|nr:hypothetical protein [Defluviitaleaceae bacterium]
ILQANGAWHTITLTATLNGSSVEVLLVNSLYVPAPAPTPVLTTPPTAPSRPSAPVAPPAVDLPALEVPSQPPVIAPPQEGYYYEDDYVPFLPVV